MNSAAAYTAEDRMLIAEAYAKLEDWRLNPEGRDQDRQYLVNPMTGLTLFWNQGFVRCQYMTVIFNGIPAAVLTALEVFGDAQKATLEQARNWLLANLNHLHLVPEGNNPQPAGDITGALLANTAKSDKLTELIVTFKPR